MLKSSSYSSAAESDAAAATGAAAAAFAATTGAGAAAALLSFCFSSALRADEEVFVLVEVTVGVGLSHDGVSEEAAAGAPLAAEEEEEPPAGFNHAGVESCAAGVAAFSSGVAVETGLSHDGVEFASFFVDEEEAEGVAVGAAAAEGAVGEAAAGLVESDLFFGFGAYGSAVVEEVEDAVVVLELVVAAGAALLAEGFFSPRNSSTSKEAGAAGLPPAGAALEEVGAGVVVSVSVRKVEDGSEAGSAAAAVEAVAAGAGGLFEEPPIAVRRGALLEALLALGFGAAGGVGESGDGEVAVSSFFTGFNCAGGRLTGFLFDAVVRAEALPVDLIPSARRASAAFSRSSSALRASSSGVRAVAGAASAEGAAL